MSEYKAPLTDIRFLFKQVFDLPSVWSSLNGAAELDWDTANAVLEEAGKICEEVIGPLNREADEQGAQWENGEVISPEGFKDAYQTFCEGAWGALGGNPEYGGMGMPKTMVSAVEEMVQGSCISFGLAPMLTAGACLAMNAHASGELKAMYLEKMYSGQWAGAMDLTEPHAGTDLGIIKTKAVSNGDGSYVVTGTKIFITWGEHDMAENIVHLVLAKLPDAPPGSKGISMFLVPKFLPNEAGELGERNAVNCGSIEKKMGIHGSATCVMNFDGAKGWLVGDQHQGLAAMFTMMNYERLVVGIQGIGVAELSYQGALAYAKERTQGRSPSGTKSPDTSADSIIVHPDVRRMLMTMKAYNEASRAFYIYVAGWLDQAKYSNTEEQKHKAQNMVALLTPVIKAFTSDVALEASIHGQQILGGHGFIREWGQEQHVRDIRITQIYEGTNGIQAMDLIGRKTLATNGQLMEEFLSEVESFSDKNHHKHSKMFSELNRVTDLLRKTTLEVVKGAKTDVNLAGSVAVDYLRLIGFVAYAYMWAKVTVAALQENEFSPDFNDAKIKTAQYFFDKMLPEVDTLAVRINKGSDATMSLADDQF